MFASRLRRTRRTISRGLTFGGALIAFGSGTAFANEAQNDFQIPFSGAAGSIPATPIEELATFSDRANAIVAHAACVPASTPLDTQITIYNTLFDRTDGQIKGFNTWALDALARLAFTEPCNG